MVGGTKLLLKFHVDDGLLADFSASRSQTTNCRQVYRLPLPQPPLIKILAGLRYFTSHLAQAEHTSCCRRVIVKYFLKVCS